MKHAQYIGDGVYVHLSSFGEVVITTGHHDPNEAKNVVIMEPSVLAEFNKWVWETKEKLEAERK